MFSLIVATLGAGTMTLPSVPALTGIITGNILAICGALLSIYTGMLLISCAEKTKSDKYEDFAFAAYGKWWSKITSICIIVCFLGIIVSYITFIKEQIPTIITIFHCGNIPEPSDPNKCEISSFIGLG